MIYHPLKKLTGAGIQEILLVSGTEHMGDFVELLGSGRTFGCNLTYRVQDEAGGIAQALGLAEHFARDARMVVILGDNIFQDSLAPLLAESKPHPAHAWVALKPSKRGELEITDVNRHYLEKDRLGSTLLGGFWTDAGTHESLLHANQLVREHPPVY